MNIVYIDGHCLICNRLVDFLLVRDHKKHLLYASLQGEHAKSHLDNKYIHDLSSVVLVQNGQAFTKSEAAIRCLALLGGPWKYFKVFLLIPKFIRDLIYNLVAINRYKLGRRLEVCPIISKEDKQRFLD